MEKKNILQEVDHNDGRTVPEGFFDRFTENMIATLPEQEWEQTAGREPVILPRTFWQKVRPYVYMAAMFAGVWLMMNMFNIFTPATPIEQLQDNAVLSEALSNEQFVDELALPTTDLDEMIEDMYAANIPVEELREAAEEETGV